ncbi:hypothetical protein J5N97_014621 [Dioscorea zingiberensis]|uniref:Uncharacterized protein n=1 Tax=Dioscorea zingiberensis TaxID=325984 RepID=A0A9D5CUB5_9LILI|nr:hypothetical protein J5N97_014621 [Dioscorea zingiberensis]
MQQARALHVLGVNVQVVLSGNSDTGLIQCLSTPSHIFWGCECILLGLLLLRDERTNAAPVNLWSLVHHWPNVFSKHTVLFQAVEALLDLDLSCAS